MSALEQLYQQVILDHARERHGRGLRDAGPDGHLGESRQYNPLCGDEVTVRVDLVDGKAGNDGNGGRGDGDPGDALVRDLSWTGEGCSISQAATSVLHDLVTGRPVREATGVVDAFRAMVRSRGAVPPDEGVLGDAAAFSGVGRHANRVKCAMLGWTAFEAALQQASVRTEPGPEPVPQRVPEPVPEESR